MNPVDKDECQRPGPGKRCRKKPGHDGECRIVECRYCDGTGWVDDRSACGDPDHCDPYIRCLVCNPEGEDPL